MNSSRRAFRAALRQRRCGDARCGPGAACASTPSPPPEAAPILQEWAILPNNTISNSLAMEFNWLTLNGKPGPVTTPNAVQDW